jgi:hypothetical protein
MLFLLNGIYANTPSITPFEITINPAQIQSLHQRLDSTIWPTVLDDMSPSDWRYGAPQSVIRELSDYLREGYNYTDEVNKMNEWPHYLADIDGMKVHFIHQKSSHANAQPIMFVLMI